MLKNIVQSSAMMLTFRATRKLLPQPVPVFVSLASFVVYRIIVALVAVWMKTAIRAMIMKT